ncbi:glycosyl hydrolase [Aspergillus pseudoustus]|uniref:Glycosyl hydrolase n=1 Tax=Aspergillus pseudoustus TaxID=1810923 RepID=A0ABR4J3N2_9EURO
MDERSIDADTRLLPWGAAPWSWPGSSSHIARANTRIPIIGVRIRRIALRRIVKMVALLLLLALLSLAFSARARHSHHGIVNDTNAFRGESPYPASSSIAVPSPSPSVVDSALSPLKTAAAGAGAEAADYPPAHGTDLHIHDPSIIYDASTASLYSYSVGLHMVIHQASSLDGPWTELGSLLPADSVIPKGDRKAPWAPSTIEIGGRFYCYYAVSNAGCRDSAIGVASSDSPGPGSWTDHGLIIQSGNGDGADRHPLDKLNTIDPSIFVDADGGGVYLMFGSFWTGIWQVRLASDLVSIGEDMDARHLAAEPAAIFPARKNANSICGDPTGGHPIEGSFLSYHAGWYYLWFSWGRCCEFKNEKMRTNGKEYRIKVGRSESARGPFVDKQGKDLVDGGGDTVYASNGDVFAPGGQGILTDEFGDILYYHYLNTTISYDFWEARLGYNRLEYVDGWPVAV